MAEYQGWTNYPTYCVHLWMSSEKPVYNYWNYWTTLAQKLLNEQAAGARAYLRDALKAKISDAMPEVQGMWSDLLTNALEEVNWTEIAEALLKDTEKT